MRAEASIRIVYSEMILQASQYPTFSKKISDEENLSMISFMLASARIHTDQFGKGSAGETPALQIANMPFINPFKLFALYIP